MSSSSSEPISSNEATREDAAVPEPASIEETPDETSATTLLGMSKTDRWVAAVIAVLLGALMLFHWMRLQGTLLEPVSIERIPQSDFEYRIDLNAADWVEIMQLPGIGRALAKQVVADRDANGPFETVDELERVRGIGPKIVETLREHAMAGAHSSKSAASSSVD